MHVNSAYRFAAEIFSAAGAPLGELPIHPDWNHAAQCVGLDAARRGLAPALYRYRQTVAVTPGWSEAGEPYVRAFMLRMCDEQPWMPIPHAYAHRAVQRATGTLVKEHKLEDGELFTYRVCAYAYDDEGAVSKDSTRRGQSLGSIEQPMDLKQQSLTSLFERSESHRPNTDVPRDETANDVPVFVRPHVIAEAQELARAAGDKEHAGFLLGRVYRDTASPEMMIEVTALIAARDARSEHARVTFTPATWEAARAAVVLRGEGEVILGWFHNHPFFCARCTAQQRARCVFSKPFFSEQDRDVHAASFGGAFQVALLVTDLGKRDLFCDMFGWRDGLVAPRSYHIMKNDAPVAVARSDSIKAV